MVTRKIYELYENVERVYKAPNIAYRMSQEEFEELLFYGNGATANSIDTPNKSADWIDEDDLVEGSYFYNQTTGLYEVSGDVLVIDEAICPDNMTEEEFNSLSFEELLEKIKKGEIEIQSYDLVVSKVPEELDIEVEEEVEFKPHYQNGLAMCYTSGLGNNEYDYTYDGYSDCVTYYFESFNDEELEAFIQDKEYYLKQAINDFADNIKDDFELPETFIITDEIIKSYKEAIGDDLERQLDSYIEGREIHEQSKPKTH